MRAGTAFCILLSLLLVPVWLGAEPRPAESLKVTVLSTMLADRGIGEWGFAALVEVDGRRFLFDTGNRPETVLQNARELGIDLSTVTDVILSHNHPDHTGGLLTLRRELMKQNPDALSRAHVATGIFWSRPSPDGAESNGMIAIREEYEASGGRFIEHSGPAELMPGVWLTGPVPRIHREQDFSSQIPVLTPSGREEDEVPEDASLVIDTAEGLVVVTGCGHAGMINTLEHARNTVRTAPIHAVIGGLHLFEASEVALVWTGQMLREMRLANLLAAHCTGIESTFRLRMLAGLERTTAVVGSVGSSFTLGAGIDPLRLAR